MILRGRKEFFLLILLFLIEWVSADYYVELSSNSPVVLGATVQFNAHLFNDDGSIPSGTFKYEWQDNSFPAKTASIESKSPNCAWNITYDRHKNPPGRYEVQVVVSEWTYLFYRWITSNRLMFNLTSFLNGKLDLVQGTQIQTRYIASGLPVNQQINLRKADLDFLNKNATSIQTMWFVNCKNVANSTGLTLVQNYTMLDETFEIEAIVIAGFDPIPPPPTPTPPPNTTTTTTTPKPTTTTSKPTTTTVPTTTTTVHTTTTKKSVRKRAVTRISATHNISYPFVCNHTELIVPSPNKTYGYFTQKVTAKAPLTKVNISGNNWLPQGELLHLVVSCTGSSPIQYCLLYETGLHNSTGNETCRDVPAPLEQCKFNISHYFRDEEQHTVFIIITNDVSKVVRSVGIEIYKAIHHPQLSVIVVPVVFSLVAVVLIVFGVAYYIQSRNRFIVEVADFDFGQQYAEMEYKTFYQRLREAMMATFIGNFFAHDNVSVDESTPGTSKIQYGSMT